MSKEWWNGKAEGIRARRDEEAHGYGTLPRRQADTRKSETRRGRGEWVWVLRIGLENDASDDFRGWRSSISEECVELQALSRETVHYKSVVGSLCPL
jgi:hypothetical protein